MLEVRDGVECFTLKDRQILITPELKKVRIPLDLAFPPPNIEELPKNLIKRLRKREIIVPSITNEMKPSYEEKCLLEKVTFKNLAFERVEYIFQEFVKNCSMVPVITIDCNLDVTSTLLKLINQEYIENSINPIVKIFIREAVNDFLKPIKEFLDARESIELNNLFLILDNSCINYGLIKKVRELIAPLDFFIYYEKIPESMEIEDFNHGYDLSILLEINEQLHGLKLTEIKNYPISINDDSIFRLINAFKLKSYTVQEVIRKQIFLPYCGACNSRLFIEGKGNIYACNTGYRSNDQLDSLENKSIKDILKSKKFKELRYRIEENSKKYQRTNCLSNFFSGCLYKSEFNKESLMKKILQAYIK